MADNTTIELRRTNLYGNAFFLQFPDGTQQVVRERVEWVGGTGDQYHTVLEGDELPFIAWKYYGRRTENAGELWWVIADVNGIVNPFGMDELIGTQLLIPNYDKFQMRL